MTTAPVPMAIAVLTRAQRIALHDAAARRASRLRKQATNTRGQSSVPEAELDLITSEAATADLISRLTASAEAIITRGISAPRRPANLTDIIVGEALALVDATAANDRDDVAQTLATLLGLVAEAQRTLLDPTTIESAAPGCWRNNGHLAWPHHHRNADITDNVNVYRPDNDDVTKNEDVDVPANADVPHNVDV